MKERFKKALDEAVKKIDIRKFYLIGSWLMIVAVTANIYNTTMIWSSLINIGAKMQMLTGIMFNILWIGFFFFLYKNSPKKINMPDKVINNPEIDKLLQDLKTGKEVK